MAMKCDVILRYFEIFCRIILCVHVNSYINILSIMYNFLLTPIKRATPHWGRFYQSISNVAQVNEYKGKIWQSWTLRHLPATRLTDQLADGPAGRPVDHQPVDAAKFKTAINLNWRWLKVNIWTNIDLNLWNVKTLSWLNLSFLDLMLFFWNLTSFQL